MYKESQGLILFLFLITLASATIPNPSQSQIFTDGHNNYRRSVNPPAKYMPDMTWNPSLSSSSNGWASRCIFQHSRTANVGENLYATSMRTPNATNFNPLNSVNSWGNEENYYNYYTNTCLAGYACGHYTQMIWDSSVYLGCAFQDCPIIWNIPWPNGGTIVVCQYYTPGNYIGQRPYVSV